MSLIDLVYNFQYVLLVYSPMADRNKDTFRETLEEVLEMAKIPSTSLDDDIKDFPVNPFTCLIL